MIVILPRNITHPVTEYVRFREAINMESPRSEGG